MIDITPDGRSLLYINVAEGETRIMRRRLEDAEAVPLAGSQRQIAGIYISRDAREYFTVDPQTGQMLRFPTDGGNPRPLPAGLAVAAYAAWGSDGTLWLSPQSDRARGVARVTSEGAVDYPLRALSDLNVVQILPGDKHAIAVRSPIGTAFGPAFIVDLQAVEATPILGVDVVEIKYVKGLLVYVLPNGTMEAVRFDIDDGRTLGRPVTIANGVGLTGFGQAHLAVSENGTVAYIPDEPRSLILVDRAGNARPATAERRNFHIPRFSPDGRRILVDFNGVDGRDVWLLDVPDGTLSRVTLDRDGHDATWGPGDGDVTYSSAIRGGGQLGIYRTRPGRGAEMDTIISDPSLSYPGVWLPDRSGLVTAGNSIQSESRSDIALVQNSGRGPIVPLVASRFDEMYPSVSRDGRWLAYTSDQSGRIEVYVRPIASGGEQLQVSAGGGTEPMWGVRGELFYRAPAAGGSQLIAASLSLSATPIVSSRQRLFDVTDIVTSSPHANYDVSPDGRTFAMVRQNPATRIVIIQNLPALVRQLEDGATGR
jgi:Tol biopolymer transport system component